MVESICEPTIFAPQSNAPENEPDLYIEDEPLRNDVRISEAFPNEFQQYCEHFIDFFPKTPYHVKTTYEKSGPYTGWVAKKRRKTKQPLALVDTKSWLNRTNTVERHLDYEQWWIYQEFMGNSTGPRTDFYWLGLNQPRMSTFNAIDADNKRYIGWYKIGDGDPLMPVMEMPLEHFVYLKKLYDTFPDRIWCVTSQTLGLDIIEKHGLTCTATTHERVKRQLTKIGYGNTEVHPMVGRCKRRPFGAHYRTITAEGEETTWQSQLKYYLSPGPTPTFRRIAETLLARLEHQWSSWKNFGHAIRVRGKLTVDVTVELASRRRETQRVRRWLDDDCPELTSTTVAVCSETSSLIEGSAVPSASRRPKAVTWDTTFDLSSLRGGKWAKELERLAINGLEAPDTVGQIVHEMAKWLWWIELFDLPEDERREITTSLLTDFVANKHNGHITRWNQGEQEDVLSQIVRCLDSAIELPVPDRENSLSLFSTIRLKRSSGQYNKVIRIAALLPGNTDLSSSSLSSLSSTLFSVSGCETLNDPLPEEIMEWIKQKKGRNKVEKYATRLCNFLFGKTNWAYIPRETAEKQFIGHTNPTRRNTYNKILQRAGVIDLETYRAHSRPTGYRLTSEAKEVMQAHRAATVASSN